MPPQSPDSPLSAFLQALSAEEIDFMLIGMMAAVIQGAPMMTIDYDFWVRLPERQYVRLLAIVRRQGGTVRAQTLYELSDGTQVNVIFRPDGLRSFEAEYRGARHAKLAGRAIRVLPLARVIASKRASGREKDLSVLPTLEKSIVLRRRLLKTKQKQSKPGQKAPTKPAKQKKL